MKFNNSPKCPGLEQALIIFPQILYCRDCGAAVEIWSDETKAKCSACGTWNSKDWQGDPRPGKPLCIDVMEYTDEKGVTFFYERYETELIFSDFVQDKKYKTACESCRKYGKNLACPPFSPTFEDYLGGFRKAKVICIRLPQEYFSHIAPEERYRACSRKARELLGNELLQFRRRGMKIAGSGPCLACEECSVEAGDQICRKPRERIFSLESLGVNLISLAKEHLHIDLEWSTGDHLANFVCAIGASFF